MLHFLRSTALLLLMAASAGAQELASTFDQLRVLVGTGDTLTITSNSGSRVRGKLSQLSSSSLVLDVSGALREFQSTEVDRIEKRGADSLNNGAITGMAIGGGLAAIALGVAQSDFQPGFVVLASFVYGGLGAGIGAGIDALIEGPRIIYAGPRIGKTTVSVSPILRGQRKGILLSFARRSPVRRVPRHGELTAASARPDGLDSPHQREYQEDQHYQAKTPTHAGTAGVKPAAAQHN